MDDSPFFSEFGKFGLRRLYSGIDYQIGSNKFDIVDDSKKTPSKFLFKGGQKFLGKGFPGFRNN
ncbi:MAG: hypothetical protein CM15mP8_0360 [Methanobacteriota archaeon]|nr:MAG: hypothetical protein CM15mP8_0360 [Euryarchaeota archaeon]